MSKNQTKSTAALQNGVKSGLINQRKGGESIKLQHELVALSAKHPGFTATQLCWKAAGFEVSDAGHCLPADLFAQVNKFFNGKRRLSEATCGPDQIEEKPRALMVYGKAVLNPYGESGGHGVYKIANRHGQTAPESKQVSAQSANTKPAPDLPISAPAPAIETSSPEDIRHRLESLQSLLD